MVGSNNQIVVCASCNKNLWMIKTYAPMTPAQKAVKKHTQAWVSMNPDQYDQEPDTWDCPCCGQKFLEIKGSLVYLKTVSGLTGKSELTLLERYSR